MRSYGQRSKFMVHDFKKIYGLIHLIIPGTRLLTVSISWSIAPLYYEIHRGPLPFFIPFPNTSLSCAIVMHKCIKYLDLPGKINNKYA